MRVALPRTWITFICHFSEIPSRTIAMRPSGNGSGRAWIGNSMVYLLSCIIYIVLNTRQQWEVWDAHESGRPRAGSDYIGVDCHRGYWRGAGNDGRVEGIAPGH